MTDREEEMMEQRIENIRAQLSEREWVEITRWTIVISIAELLAKAVAVLTVISAIITGVFMIIDKVSWSVAEGLKGSNTAVVGTLLTITLILAGVNVLVEIICYFLHKHYTNDSLATVISLDTARHMENAGLNRSKFGR